MGSVCLVHQRALGATQRTRIHGVRLLRAAGLMHARGHARGRHLMRLARQGWAQENIAQGSACLVYQRALGDTQDTKIHGVRLLRTGKRMHGRGHARGGHQMRLACRGWGEEHLAQHVGALVARLEAHLHQEVRKRLGFARWSR